MLMHTRMDVFWDVALCSLVGNDSISEELTDTTLMM
jgi:hypothetical protein